MVCPFEEFSKGLHMSRVYGSSAPRSDQTFGIWRSAQHESADSTMMKTMNTWPRERLPKRIQRWSGSVDIWDAISVNACQMDTSLAKSYPSAWYKSWVTRFVQRASQNFAELSNYEKPQRTKMRSRAKPFSK